MKITKTHHGNAGTLRIGDTAIPIVEWSAEFEADGRWWHPGDVARWVAGKVGGLTRSERRLMRKERGKRSR